MPGPDPATHHLFGCDPESSSGGRSRCNTSFSKKVNSTFTLKQKMRTSKKIFTYHLFSYNRI